MKDGLLDQIAGLRAQQADIIKTIQAIARVVGAGEVQAEIAAGDRAEMEKSVKDAVRAGQAVEADVVTEGSFVVGVEAQPDGNPIYPGRFQFSVASLPEESRKLFVGKKANESFKLDNGNTILVKEIYEAPKAAPKKAVRKKKVAKPVPAETKPAN